MAESAARAGFEVTSLDAFGDLDQHPDVRAYSLPRDFGVDFSAAAASEIARTIESDAVAYQSPFENHPLAVARLGRGRTVWGNSDVVLRRVRDPRVLPSVDDVSSDRWLLKPRASGGGHGIRWWEAGDPVPSGSHVQRFVEGAPGSIVFVAARGRCVPLGLTSQLAGDPAFGASGFRYCGSILCHSARSEDTSVASPSRQAVGVSLSGQPKDLHRPDGRLSLLESATTLAREFARRFDLVGVNCIDLIDHAGKAVPIEVNPRWSASMELVEQAYRLSVFGAHAAACSTGELPPFDLTRAASEPSTLGKAIVFARHDVTCGDTRSWLDDPTVRDIPRPGEHIAAGRPVCTVFARGTSAASCRHALVARADRVYATLEAWASVSV